MYIYNLFYIIFWIASMSLGALWRFSTFVSLWPFRGWEKDKGNVHTEGALWWWCGEIKD